VPLPTATQTDPFQATVLQAVVNGALATAFQLIPSDEYAKTFEPVPPATQTDPFHAKVFTVPPEKTKLPLVDPVQLRPSNE
jgi:hypothetical protein